MGKNRLRKNRVEWREVEGEIVALDLDRSDYISVNPSGTILWRALIEGSTNEALIDLLIDQFEVTREQAAADVNAFITGLKERDLLESVE